MHEMNIGEAAAAAGMSARMVRHYEHIGLLEAAGRSDAGYRRYGPREVDMLRFVQAARRLGFATTEIAELLGLWQDSRRRSRSVKAVAQRHLAELDTRLAELTDMRQALQRLVETCGGDDEPHCAILDRLAAERPAKAAVSGRKGGAEKRGRAAPPAPAAELMAWTRRVRATA